MGEPVGGGETNGGREKKWLRDKAHELFHAIPICIRRKDEAMVSAK